ncbi:hypothetical protein A2933_01760 [Candidatus Nomurabacteria bacterium RIFCSPLOWO2_01_FULL_46_18]|uniref:Solute-binding protein family 5 domain-containing protein n=1 Tax=Candidatus Nomurabacteria bacterium RIFCSPLOWO2_01_FULL_46_18 TaxID=1801783 RepID=A0A1F6XC90_9BACT|nr:MAG: hypothetical protein A2933_01760 [Candidatus Nomurabacteria bacterium RIFCSPLOWO2_01_FULL_46_18]
MKLPSRSEINSVFASFSKKEWILFGVLAAALLFSTLAILESINKSFMVSIPAEGGVIREGIVGTPRFINPALANSPADRDLSALVYSGLLRESDQGFVPDLAESYEVSKDGLTYTFVLKDNIYFHDDMPVTADDVIFTTNKVRDPVIKSPRGSSWGGAVAEKIDGRTVKFTLRQPHASFLKDSTLGILPEHIWGKAPIELNTANTDPVGSGPYRVSKVNKQSSGIIDSYELSSFKKFSLGKPYIKKIILRFYPNENELVRALQSGEIDQAGSLTPMVAETLKEKKYRIESSVLPRIFGLFFNQNENQLFIDKNILRAIDQAINKDRIVRNVFLGYGVAIDGPIPPNLAPDQNSKAGDILTQAERLARAEEILAKAGWKKNAEGFLEKTATVNKKKTTSALTFSISTGNAPELAQAAELIKEDLAAIGMKVEVKTFEVGNLNQAVIRPRKYDALLFGEVISQITDLSAFWHSSQRKDPGLNVAMYTNVKVDKILEEASVLIDEAARAKKYSQFEDEIKKDTPAVFLYSPKFIYAVSPDLEGLSVGKISSPEDRFLGSYLWFTATDNIWKIFKK